MYSTDQLNYNDVLNESNFKETLRFVTPAQKNNDENQKSKRKQNIIWFNPPYSKYLKTNTAKTFLQLLSENFPKDHEMHKIFNKNTVKISYTCMNNISSILSTHNKDILNPKQTSFGCSRRNKDHCPLDGECLTPNIIYPGDITTDNDHKFYYGTSEATFKKRHSNHTRDFKHVKYQHATEPAKHIKDMWQLKNNNFYYSIKWWIASKVYGNANPLSCKLCLMEKHWIIKYFDDSNLSNKKSDVINKCRHQNKILLMNIKR